MRKRMTHDGHENQERWLLTYADMITLLMAFFIMMYSMSVLNMSKFREAAVSIRSGFGGKMSGQGKSVSKSGGRYAAQASVMSGEAFSLGNNVFKDLLRYISDKAGKDGGVGIREEERGIVITLMSDRMLFDPGSAELREKSWPILDRIAETLDKIGNPVRVEGHTCDLPPRNSQYPTNWELSTARATNVLRYLVEQKGLDPSQFSAGGYGSAKPMARNADAASRRRNRRVEIVILRATTDEPTSGSGVPREEIRRAKD